MRSNTLTDIMNSAVTKTKTPNTQPLKKQQTLNTQLLKAAGANRCDAIRRYLENGANVNYANKSGMTPLMLACYRKAHLAVSVLIANGAKCTTLDNKGRSCDVYAAGLPINNHGDATNRHLIALMSTAGAVGSGLLVEDTNESVRL